MNYAALVLLLMAPGAAYAQTIVQYPPAYFSAISGSVKCAYWPPSTNLNPSTLSEIAVYNSGILDTASIQHFPAPANGTAIFPCPAPLDRFQIAVSATGVITASIVPLPPPPPTTYAFVYIEFGKGEPDGIKRSFALPTMPKGGLLAVSVNGLQQKPTAYSLSGQIVTFTFAPPAGADLLGLYN